jgi:hypothetical protein
MENKLEVKTGRNVTGAYWGHKFEALFGIAGNVCAAL